jgi:GNAT superfamily N-acetyltransferase
VVRETAADGTSCQIVLARPGADVAGVAELVAAEAGRARSLGQQLEWKVYDHDDLPGLEESLRGNGFKPDDVETVLALELTDAAIEHVVARAPSADVRSVDVRRVDVAGLDDVAAISADIGRSNVDAERRRLAAVLAQAPATMSVHVAYVDDVAAACGRAHYREGGPLVGIAGARTRTSYRRQGLFTALVAGRLAEARGRGCRLAVVDALPTSEPILTGLGFVPLTRTRPWVLG